MNRQMIAGLALLLCGSAANAADEEGYYNNPEAFSCPEVLQAIGTSAQPAPGSKPQPPAHCTASTISEFGIGFRAGSRPTTT
jgi:hypothetical protein